MTPVTRVTKQKKVKDPHKVSAGKIGAVVRTHNLKQKLLNDIKGRKHFEEGKKRKRLPLK